MPHDKAFSLARLTAAHVCTRPPSWRPATPEEISHFLRLPTQGDPRPPPLLDFQPDPLASCSDHDHIKRAAHAGVAPCFLAGVYPVSRQLAAALGSEPGSPGSPPMGASRLKEYVAVWAGEDMDLSE